MTRAAPTGPGSHTLTPEDQPLLKESVRLPDAGPLSTRGDVETRLGAYRRRGLTEAEALSWLLTHDLGLHHREVARVRGVARKTAENLVSRARLKIGYGFTWRDT